MLAWGPGAGPGLRVPALAPGPGPGLPLLETSIYSSFGRALQRRAEAIVWANISYFGLSFRCIQPLEFTCSYIGRSYTMAKKVFKVVDKRNIDRKACAYEKIRHLKNQLSSAKSKNTLLKAKVLTQKATIKRQRTQIGVLEATKKQALILAKGYKYANGILEHKMKKFMQDSSKAFFIWRGWCKIVRKRWEGK